ncbi:MAG: hypothetical protein ACE5HS_20745 [bacterium]
MNKKPTRCLLLFKFSLVIVLFFCGDVFSQEQQKIRGQVSIPDSNHVQVIKTTDGSSLLGRITEIRESEIQFEGDFGSMTIAISKIKEIKEIPVTAIKKGGYWFPNPNVSRLFFAPTSRMLKQGEGYFADIYLFFPGFAYGVTDNITIGGGMSLIPGVDIEDQIFYFTPKIGVQSSKDVSFAVGALLIALPDIDNDSPFAGILYGGATFGTSDKSLSVGLGYGFVDDDFADKPMLLVGGEARVSRRVSLVSENWVLPGVEDAIISYGVRFFGEKLSVDLALLNTLGEDFFFPGLPYVDFVFNF